MTVILDRPCASSTLQKEYGSLHNAGDDQEENDFEDGRTGLIMRSSLDRNQENSFNGSFQNKTAFIRLGGIIFFAFSLSCVWLTHSGTKFQDILETMSSSNLSIELQNESSSTTEGMVNTVSSSTSSPTFFKELPWRETSKKDHFVGVLEFCSDKQNNTFGYGLAGDCVPGQPAPVIRMRPKTYYQLTLINNGYIDTNLHTHGLHVSGIGSVDDITRNVEPGKCLVYQYYIPDDADVGTFWYHPHRHPLVTKTAFGGAYGMLIVDETVHDYYPPHLENFLKHNEIMLQFSSMFNKREKNAVRNNRVNGHHHLYLTLAPDVYYYFRVSAVVYDKAVNYLEFSPRESCDVRPVAYDGVYRSVIPHPDSMHKHMLTVSSRLDLAVRCTADAVLYFHQGKRNHKSRMVHILLSNNIPRQQKKKSSASLSGIATDDIASIMLSPNLPSSPYRDLENKMSWKPRRPYYMPDLSSEKSVDEFWTVSMDNYYTNGTKGLSINQVTWDPITSIRTFDLNQLVEMSIYKSHSHPFHTHINRMQIVEPGGCGGRFEEGEYFDTITSDQEECTVRMQFFDFSGRLAIHCHLFGHEDKGMMTWIDVLGGPDHEDRGFAEVSCSPAAL